MRLSDTLIIEALKDVEPAGFDWTTLAAAELAKFKAISEATAARIKEDVLAIFNWPTSDVQTLRLIVKYFEHDVLESK